MSTKTPNIELTKPSSDENYSVAVWNGNSDTIDTEMALRVKTSDIQNSLTSTATNKPLSAAQGKALNDSKVNISDIQNNLTSTATNKPLSAAMGKSLSDTKANKTDVVENAVLLENGINLNTVTKSGFYRILGTCVNGPSDGTGNYSTMMVCRGSDTITQIIGVYNASMLKYRTGRNIGTSSETWYTWNTVTPLESYRVPKIWTTAWGTSLTFTISQLGHILLFCSQSLFLIWASGSISNPNVTISKIAGNNNTPTVTHSGTAITVTTDTTVTLTAVMFELAI